MNIWTYIKENKAFVLTVLISAILVVLKSLKGGTDINVYLYASEQMFKGENIYSNNQYNFYLYSPLFALLLRPLSVFEFSIARVLWALINLCLVFRLWHVGFEFFKSEFEIYKSLKLKLALGVGAISTVILIHNFNLGQITVLIMYLMFEGLNQIFIHNKNIKGAAFLALGINIKIIPMIALFYLFFKAKYRALFTTVGLLLVTLALPTLIVGHDYNLEMHKNWLNTINPSGERYVFENNNGTHSLSALLPAYFFDFNEDVSAPQACNRHVASVPYQTLVYVMQGLRVTILLSSLFLIFYNYKNRTHKNLYVFWELSFLCLVSALIFPHQQKYAMLYFVPSGAYMMFYLLRVLESKEKLVLRNKIITSVAVSMMMITAISSRDVIGGYCVEVLDFYHVSGINNLIMLVLLYLVKPEQIIKLNKHVGITS